MEQLTIDFDNLATLSDAELTDLRKRVAKWSRLLKAESESRKNIDVVEESLKKTYKLYQDWSRRGRNLVPKYRTLGFLGWTYDEFKQFMIPRIGELTWKKPEVLDYMDYIDAEVPAREEEWRTSR